MKLVRPVLFAAAALATVVPALAVGGLLAPAGASPATTCMGKPVTIVATAKVMKGTEGDDVVAMTPGAWNSFSALGGDDTICLTHGAPSGGRDPQGSWGYVNAGHGNDVVVNESTQASSMTIFLGAGEDRFIGSSYSETVFTDVESDDDFTPSPGSQRDVVEMGGGASVLTYGDEVWTLPSADGLNADAISFGSGSAELHYRGSMTPQGSVDLSQATPTFLNLSAVLPPDPKGAERKVLVDAPAARVTVDGAQALAWQGHVDTWEFGEYQAPSWDFSVSFLGTEADESLSFVHGYVGEVRLGAGDDSVEGGYGNWLHTRALDGGPGRDRVEYYRACQRLTARLGSQVDCDGQIVPLNGFEHVVVSSIAKRSRVTAIGTDGRDSAHVFGDRVAFHGGRGADQAVLSGKVARANGGPGADRLTAFARDAILRGHGGPDVLTLSYNDLRYKRAHATRQVALGGPGNDVLAGSSTKVGDRLIGGPGRDRVNGRGGKDYCDAEITKACKRAQS
ncbi:hypothetical protein [Nocardioides campestrisoli]|uniref:hypothetical protein n=1 Tax=Nocardioides campestrisoli TaxID=2736757 RepID=UPI0015E7DBA3|nr:hypothetical protein [Nocardioides campestrisoli]